jgi:hypothetical protein
VTREIVVDCDSTGILCRLAYAIDMLLAILHDSNFGSSQSCISCCGITFVSCAVTGFETCLVGLTGGIRRSGQLSLVKRCREQFEKVRMKNQVANEMKTA